MTVSVIQLVGEYLFNQRVREEERVTEELAGHISPLLTSYKTDDMYALLRATGEEYNARVLVLNAYGVVQADSKSILNGHVLPLEEVKSVLGGLISDYGYYQASPSDSFLMEKDTHAGAMTGIYARSIMDDGALVGVLVYASTEHDIYDGLIQVTRQIAYVMLAVSAFVCLLSIVIVRLFMRPVNELQSGIAQISKGDFSYRVRVRGKDELSDLARAFNSMSTRIETLDRSRNQFVSNASHELKTPLSTMKILLQTVLYQDSFDTDMTKEFLGDIDKEIDRLSYVVSDLLTLVSIDSGKMRLNAAPLLIRDLVQENVKRLSPLARERGIELEFAGRENAEVMGDTMKLNQVFYNLIDNAIKYTPRGGSVRVDLTRQGKTVFTRIIDNGIGIPKEDVLHIFDRFYRVDKARSRETGGTGLGLSIVKQIVLLHSGDISVSSVENEGTTFVVELPVYIKPNGGKNA